MSSLKGPKGPEMSLEEVRFLPVNIKSRLVSVQCRCHGAMKYDFAHIHLKGYRHKCTACGACVWLDAVYPKLEPYDKP